MSRYQITLSITCFLAAATGLFALARKVAIGSAHEAWSLFCLLTCIALIIAMIIDRLPMTHGAVFRATRFESWSDISKGRHYCIMLFDWPLYYQIRDREERRLLDEPLVQIICQVASIRLQPVEIQHRTRFFLGRIVSAVAHHGLKAQYNKGTAEVWVGEADPRIMQYIRDAVCDGDLVSLRRFNQIVEHGFIATLAEEDRSAYMMWIMR